MIIKVEVQTEYERFIIQIPNVPENMKPEELACQTVLNILNAVDDAKVVFAGADDREGQLIYIHGGSKSVKHIALLPNEEPTDVEMPSPEYNRQEGPVPFKCTTTFLGQIMKVAGICYVYPKRAGLFGSIYLPQEINGKPALDLIDVKNIQELVTGWRVSRGDKPEDFGVLVAPGELSPHQAIAYCQDYVKLLKAETPHEVGEMTAKAYFGMRPNAGV